LPKEGATFYLNLRKDNPETFPLSFLILLYVLTSDPSRRRIGEAMACALLQSLFPLSVSSQKTILPNAKHSPNTNWKLV